MASEQDAARDRVLAARAELASSLADLEASGRAAIDIPARIRRSPAKAAAIGGGALFLLLRGPQRVIAAVRRRVSGAPSMPKGLLPKDVERTLRSLGDDGEKVRKVLERDFADYVKTSQKDRKGLVSVALLALVRPMVASGARRAWAYLSAPSPAGYPTRLDEVRARVDEKAGEAKQAAERAGSATRERVDRATDEAKAKVDRAADVAKEGIDRTGGAAKERIEQARASSRRAADEERPTGI